MSLFAWVNKGKQGLVLKMGHLVDMGRFVMSGDVGIFEKSQVGLAKKLNAARKTVARWMKEDGCPGKTEKGFNVAAWQLWVAESGKAPRAVPTMTKQDLDAEHVRLKNEKLELEMSIKRGELISQDEACKVFGEMVSGFVTELRQMKHQIPADLIGVDVGEAAKRLGKEVDERLTSLSLGNWAQKKMFWSALYVLQQDLFKRFSLGDGVSDM
jgi:hypothetical protein